MQVSGTQVVQALSDVNIIKRLHMLQLDNNAIFDKDIQDIVPDDYAIISHNDRMLAPYCKLLLLHFMNKRAFIDLFEKTHA